MPNTFGKFLISKDFRKIIGNPPPKKFSEKYFLTKYLLTGGNFYVLGNISASK